MPEYQLLRCEIALGGDRGTIVARDRFRPIMFPELVMLQYLHGEDAVSEVYVVGTCEMPVEEVRTRLTLLYGEEAVRAVFPGARPNYPRADSTIPICEQPIMVPRPTRPESPDPILRPLDQFTQGTNVPREYFTPTPDELAAHESDQTEGETDPEFRVSPEVARQIDATGDELGLGVSTKPTGAALAGGRPGYATSHSGERRGNLPDVAATSTDRKSGRHQPNAR